MEFLCNSVGLTALAVISSLVLLLHILPSKLQNQKKKKYHPIGGTVLNQLLHFNKLHHYMTGLASKHSSYRLLGAFRTEIYTSDPVNVEYSLKTNFENYGKGDYNYSNLSDLLGDGIFTVDGDKWRHQRKVSSYEFSTKVMRDFSSVVFRRNVVKLADIISEAATCNQPMDIQDLFMKSTLDSIFKVAFGVELDSMCGSNEEGREFSNAFDDASAISLWRYVDVFWKVKKFFNIGSEATLKKKVKVAEEIWEAVTTTSTSTTADTKKLSNFVEFAESVTDKALEKMHYLHAAITETLRLYPAVPVDAKVCFSDDTFPDGFSVMKGDMVAYQPYAMGRMKAIWGDDCEQYKPERWLNDKGVFQPESPFKFTAFQAGPRICLGKEFAYRQMKIFSAVLVGSFVFKLSDETKPVNYSTMINLHVDGGLHVLAAHRNSRSSS
ncbi:unnamed protein product [Linum trigynum]|uniref:Cytochrome P450 n=1 Tax=Linum trigynum TaxID=586398 RepID=A0AAV2D8Y6_9ROSI